MSAAAADPALAAIAPAKGGKKKMIVLGSIVVLLVLFIAAAATIVMLKKRADHAAAAAIEDDVATVAPGSKKGPEHPPTFVTLEPFVVNLADKDADRYAQVGIVLEVDDAVFADRMKTYMPSIRNAILLLLASKSSRELLDRSGKEQLADEILRETVRPLGIDIPAPQPIDKKPADASKDEAGSDDGAAPPRHREPRRRAPHNPVSHVNFSNFIIQ